MLVGVPERYVRLHFTKLRNRNLSPNINGEVSMAETTKLSVEKALEKRAAATNQNRRACGSMKKLTNLMRI
jgi:hypothetical protein